jgi:hypothetical protein
MALKRYNKTLWNDFEVFRLSNNNNNNKKMRIP